MSSWSERCVEVRTQEHTLAHLLDVPMELCPEKTALVFEGGGTTYAELDAAANRVANGLIGEGVAPGDRVVVQLDNRPAFLELFFGVLRAGGVFVPASPMYRSEEMQHIVADSGARVVFLDSDVEEPLYPEAERVRPDVTRAPGDTAMIQYTSGTTGRPKGAMVSHANVLAAIDMLARAPRFPVHERTVTLLVLPLFHAFGLDVGLGLSMAFGTTMVLMRRFNAAALLRLVEEQRVTLFWGVPPMFHAFANTPELDGFDASSLEGVMSGAAPLPVSVLERVRERLGIVISESYGLSESSPILCFNANGPVDKPGSVGPPFGGVELSIRDEGDREVARGEVGEVCARGPNVFQGYWRQPEATAAALRQGWLHTGDLGRLDEDGYLFLVDRKKDMVLVSGYNVYPIEVENALLRHPAVLDCAIIGVPDDYQGEAVKAFVVRRADEPLSVGDVQVYCREHLAAYKCPRHVAFVDELPRSPAGKVLKRLLRTRG
jgi:long-chain acyl-CoA synthetase